MRVPSIYVDNSVAVKIREERFYIDKQDMHVSPIVIHFMLLLDTLHYFLNPLFVMSVGEEGGGGGEGD